MLSLEIKVLKDFIRDQALEMYVQIERQYKFKNRGLIYLISLFDENVPKML
jgi:hypothetical protein